MHAVDRHDAELSAHDEGVETAPAKAIDDGTQEGRESSSKMVRSSISTGMRSPMVTCRR